MPLSEYSQGKLGDNRAIHFGISNVGHRKRRVTAKKTGHLEAAWPTPAGPPWGSVCVSVCRAVV